MFPSALTSRGLCDDWPLDPDDGAPPPYPGPYCPNATATGSIAVPATALATILFRAPSMPAPLVARLRIVRKERDAGGRSGGGSSWVDAGTELDPPLVLQLSGARSGSPRSSSCGRGTSPTRGPLPSSSSRRRG